MGYLTTITIKNDALHAFEADAKEFAKAIFEGINRANSSHKAESVAFKCYANYIEVQPSRHADDQTLYLHSGNTVFNLNPYGQDFIDLKKSSPDLLSDFIKRAEQILKIAKKMKDYES